MRQGQDAAAALAEWLRLKRLERSVRERRAVSMAEVADAAGISRQYMAFLEAGKRRPSAEVVSRIARALGAPEEEALEMLGYVGPSISPRVVGLARRLDRLSDADLRRAERLILAAFPGLAEAEEEDDGRVTRALAA